MPFFHSTDKTSGPQRRPALDRRGFLRGLGLLAGAGALAPLLAREREAGPRRVEASRVALGTWVRVVARDRDPATAERALQGAFAAIERVEEQMSIHRAGSQISRVNRLAGSEISTVDPNVIEVVDRACRAAERSGGIFDPTILPLMNLFGFYGHAANGFPNDRAIDHALAATGWRQVEIDRAAGTLGLARRGAGIDLGSIGKGWAVDRAVAAMRNLGVEHGLVDAGGNVYAFGDAEPGEVGWTVGVLHPVTRGVDRVFRLRDSAIATSGNAEQTHWLGGIRIGHLLDARRGRPAEGPLSTSVVAANAVDADLLSTVAFVLGPARFDWPEATIVHHIG